LLRDLDMKRSEAHLESIGAQRKKEKTIILLRQFDDRQPYKEYFLLL